MYMQIIIVQSYICKVLCNSIAGKQYVQVYIDIFEKYYNRTKKHKEVRKTQECFMQEVALNKISGPNQKAVEIKGLTNYCLL